MTLHEVHIHRRLECVSRSLLWLLLKLLSTMYEVCCHDIPLPFSSRPRVPRTILVRPKPSSCPCQIRLTHVDPSAEFSLSAY